jgi:hypothetical protein
MAAMKAAMVDNFDATSSKDDLNAIFSKAQEDFLAELSEPQRALYSRCSSPQELLSSCEQFEVISKAKKRGLPFLKRIKSFSENLSPYFKIMEILCAAHPEWANIALGAFRLVLAVRPFI